MLAKNPEKVLNCTSKDISMYDLIILGSGPAGLTAAIYAARAGKKTLVLGGDAIGGQMGGIPELENYPGFMGSGAELADKMKKQAEQFGAEFVFANAKTVVSPQSTAHSILADNGKTYEAKSIIIATGASPKKLEIAGAKEFTGRGVSYCATCDGFFYSGKDVLVIGGGNSALNDALYLANLAKKVYISYRKPSFSRAEAILVERVKAKDNIECLFETIPESVSGDESGLTHIKIINHKSEIINLPVDGVFVAIGHEANTDFLSEEYKRDEMGRIIGNALPAGMFAAGDVRSGEKMQVATAVGTGCDAAMDAIAYLNAK
jgi:thioredoxin reductase (NADPH)